MSDHPEDVKPCPFCGMLVDFDDPDTLYTTGIYWRESGGVRLYIHRKYWQEGDGEVWGMNCPEPAGGCGVEMRGDTKEEVLEKWNRRSSECC